MFGLSHHIYPNSKDDYNTMLRIFSETFYFQPGILGIVLLTTFLMYIC